MFEVQLEIQLLIVVRDLKGNFCVFLSINTNRMTNEKQRTKKSNQFFIDFLWSINRLDFHFLTHFHIDLIIEFLM